MEHMRTITFALCMICVSPPGNYFLLHSQLPTVILRPGLSIHAYCYRSVVYVSSLEASSLSVFGSIYWLCTFYKDRREYSTLTHLSSWALYASSFVIFIFALVSGL